MKKPAESQSENDVPTGSSAKMPSLHLVTTRGKMAFPNAEACRPVHNQTAGHPQSAEFARSMSDLSHNVFVPLMGDQNELLFLDIWYDPTSRKAFFANPQVEQGGKAIFSRYERNVWNPAEDFLNYFVPSPHGKNDRFLGLIRGVVKSREEARAVFNEARALGLNAARRAGSLFHQIYFREADSDSGTLDLIGVDYWNNAEEMMKYYERYDTELGKAFSSPLEPSVWKRPAGEWVEW
jgi:hypothetical protein